MNVLNTNDLRPGQHFSAPVYTEGDYMLVAAMVPLRQKDIDVLITWGIDYVRTEGSIVEVEEISEAEILDETVKADDTSEIDEIMSSISSPSKKAVIRFSISEVRQNSGPYRAYKNLIEKLNSVFSGLKSGADVEMRAVNNICVQLLQDLRDNPDSFVGFILGGEVSGHELAKSSVNTAILSGLTAQELKLPNHKINNIIAGALLHDVGMLRLSKGITEKKGGLSEAELEQIKSHPLHTSKIVTKELFGPHEVNLIALQHHERWDGQGYPDKLVGNAIDIGARIVSVADAFEAMVSKKSYRNSMVGYQAVKNLLSDNARRFDPAVIISFTKIMGIYPIGSIVCLNDTSMARVVSIHTDAPLRPVVQMLMDNKGNALGSGNMPIVDLLVERTLFIKEAIDPAEYAE
ncbi:MAG: HD-GYP domain-containing protein [Treponema sp.]|nr:HD-GYP domain-containing protein [Treponema sp.]